MCLHFYINHVFLLLAIVIDFRALLIMVKHEVYLHHDIVQKMETKNIIHLPVFLQSASSLGPPLRSPGSTSHPPHYSSDCPPAQVSIGR